LTQGEFINCGRRFSHETFIGGDDQFEGLLDGASGEGGQDLLPPAARCDGQPVLSDRLFQKTGHPGKQCRFVGGGMVTKEDGFPFDDPGMDSVIAGAIPLFEQRGGAGPFIHAEVGSVILLLAQAESGFIQSLLKAFQVRRFIVGDDAVEVKNDRAQRSLPQFAGSCRQAHHCN